jgi:hypothetical protein
LLVGAIARINKESDTTNITNREDSQSKIPGFWVIPKKYIVISKKFFFHLS